jgi:hypothetical protein
MIFQHQAITELAESGAPDATLMALAGHVSRAMMEHSSHVRMASKCEALEKFSTGLIAPASSTLQEAANNYPLAGYVTIYVTEGPIFTREVIIVNFDN